MYFEIKNFIVNDNVSLSKIGNFLILVNYISQLRKKKKKKKIAQSIKGTRKGNIKLDISSLLVTLEYIMQI